MRRELLSLVSAWLRRPGVYFNPSHFVLGQFHVSGMVYLAIYKVKSLLIILYNVSHMPYGVRCSFTAIFGEFAKFAKFKYFEDAVFGM